MQPLIDYLLVLQVAEFCINWSRTPSFAAHIKKSYEAEVSRWPMALLDISRNLQEKPCNVLLKNAGCRIH